MSEGRLERLLDRLAGDAGDLSEPGPLCVASAAITGTSGAAIMLMHGDGLEWSVCTSDDTSAMIEELQYTLGEGPCVDAYTENRPISEPDLTDPAATRWPSFGDAAVAAGARAVFGFPITVDGVRLGALNLYRDLPGPLTADQHADAVLLADLTARAIIGMHGGANPSSLAVDFDRSNFHFVVHQAAGMVSAQAAVTVTDALALLRAHAFSHDRSITDVAEDVIDRRLRFHPDGDSTQP